MATAISPAHTQLVPALFGIFAAAIVLRLIVRVNTELAGLLTQVIRTMAAIGRMVTTVVVAAGVAVIILLHCKQRLARAARRLTEALPSSSAPLAAR